MSSSLPLNAGRFPIGLYVVQFVEQELCIAQADEPEQVILRLDLEAALDLTDWLGLSRQRLYAAVMNDGLERFKAQACARYHLPEDAKPDCESKNS